MRSHGTKAEIRSHRSVKSRVETRSYIPFYEHFEKELRIGFDQFSTVINEFCAALHTIE